MLKESRVEDTARPKSGSTETAECVENSPSSNPSGGPPGPPSQLKLRELDRVLYSGPYVLIDADNHSPRRTRSLDRAYAAIDTGEVATAGGTLRPGNVGADIDPLPEHAVLGDAVAEVLVGWLHDQGISYLARESGRPGGRHVVGVGASPDQMEEWNRLCADTAQAFGVPVDDRSGGVLRLLAAPHRKGYAAPVLGGTLTLNAPTVTTRPSRVRSARPARRRTSPSSRPAPTGPDTSRSAREYGQVCAMIRRGCTPAEAWRVQNRPGSKASERGEHRWRRFVWLDAHTTVCAEERLTPEQAWQRVSAASPAVCRKIGRRAWQRLWERAVDQAGVQRPRRRRLPPASDPLKKSTGEDNARIAAVAAGLKAALDATDLGVRRQRRRNCEILLLNLAPILVRREGSISVRDIALRAGIDVKTFRACRDLLIAHGLLVTAHHYAGGASDSHAYAMGPAARPHVEDAVSKISPTCPKDTPLPPTPSGRANRTLLRTRFRRERHHWRTRCAALDDLPPGASLASSSSPAVKAYRSLRYQQRWWRSLSCDEQEARRTARRATLETLTPSARSAWFNWLDRRNSLMAVVDRAAAGTFTPTDRSVLAAAPRTVHTGLQDPSWQPGSPGSRQLVLAA
ncbi:hypothetical protein [Nocardia cyriacigeorgica]|uniref:hypothetical protein n=1 Tax=Nocardia cyriacigeorgica TaxID=135487 RepID=UPI001F40E6D0|nr:hypothetical protein [Nocardia cyriacigeorgica]